MIYRNYKIILISFKKEQDMSRFSLLAREDDLNFWIDCIKTCFHIRIFVHAVSFTFGMETMISHFIYSWFFYVHYVLWYSLTLTRYGYFWWIEAFGTVPLWWISKRKKSCWPLWTCTVRRKHSSQAVSINNAIDSYCCMCIIFLHYFIMTLKLKLILSYTGLKNMSLGFLPF